MLLRQSADRRAAARGSSKPPGHTRILLLDPRAVNYAQFKALLEAIATSNANQEQRDIFQRHVDDLRARSSRPGHIVNQAPPSATMSQQVLVARMCLQSRRTDSD